MTIQGNILEWLYSRRISKEVIENSGIYFENNWLVIPIRDQNKNVIFNKYRRSPFANDGPKYKYENGSRASLFNIHLLKDNNDIVFLTEGELDALALQSLGLNAISTTGGAGTFKEKWKELFNNRDVIICYDNDSAGIKGAVKVAKILDKAKIAILFHCKTKDITEYIQEGMGFNDPYFFVIDFEKNDINGMIKRINKLKTEITSKIPARLQPKINPLDILVKEIAIKKNKTMKTVSTNKNILDIPITNFVDFSKDDMARCVFHDEKTGSMKYYKDTNTVYCFGCSKWGNVINIVSSMKNISYTEAKNILSDSIAK